MFGGVSSSDTIPGEPWGGLKPRAPVPPGAVQIQGAPPAGGSRSTQMFGTVDAPAAVPAQERSATQVFGSAAAAAASVPTPAKGRSGPKPAQVFGGGQLPAAVPAVEQREPTQMFGSVAPVPATGPKATQMFGGVSAPPAPAPSPATGPKATQMFGGVSAPPGPAPPPPPATPQKATQMFAGLSASSLSSPAVPSDRAPTQLWTSPNSPAGGAPPALSKPAPAMSGAPPAPGAAAPSPAAATPPKPAQMFGVTASPVSGSAPPPKSTQMYGAGLLDEQPPTPPNLATTQLFGGISDTPAPAPAALPKILSVTPSPLPDESFADTVIRDRNRQPDPQSTARTQMFGAPDESELERAWKERSQQKSRFGVTDVTQPDAGPVQGRGDPTTIPEQPHPFRLAETPLDLPQLGGSTPLDTPASSRATTPSDMPSETPRATRLELPPEAPELLPEPRTEESGAGVDDALFLRKQLQRRTRIAAIAVGVALLVVVGGIAGRALVNRRHAVPPDAIARLESARLLMRRDDVQSRNRAVTELSALISAYQDFVPAHAELVVALSLQLDDARIQVRRLTEESDEAHRRIARLSDDKAPSDWQNRVMATQARVAEIAALITPLNEKSGAIDNQLNDRFQALQGIQPNGIEDQRSLARAQAVYSGVKGSDTAIALAERYRNLGGTDGWAAVALAELALNARVSPEAMTTAHAEMDELAAKDSTFLRSYVLSARLSIAQKHNDSAVAGLEAVLALNPAHDIARQLLEWARSGEPER
jgi:hypothetical protein